MLGIPNLMLVLIYLDVHVFPSAKKTPLAICIFVQIALSVPTLPNKKNNEPTP